MAKTNKKLEWLEVDLDTLSPKANAKLKALREAWAASKAAKEAFEDAAMDGMLPPAGKRIVFGYQFGKISFAFDDAKGEAKRSSGGVSLADYLEREKASGRRA